MGGETCRRCVRMRIVFSKMGRQKKTMNGNLGVFQDDQQDPTEGHGYGQGHRRPHSRACIDGRLEHGWRERGERGRQSTTTKL